ncbi:hypothetical protein Ga0102493_111349 [Erythrobacter litoralis]|uniref:hypothetical protein n=1 Tax=Erythrobacter litoralis TaxID=39960 RepID=UPI0008639E3F|nr:hypothetical protein [Erythrobacter litoralis]AOL22376.1 hypothetical protein Ga0102493_111349 [Erythrobacter litoralis]
MTGAALSIEGAVLTSGQVQASTIWGHGGNELSSTFQANAYYPLVSGSIKLRIPDESVEDQSTMARSFAPRRIKGVSLLKQTLINPFRDGPANSVIARKALLEEDFSPSIQNHVLPLGSDEAGRIRVFVGSNVEDALITRVIHPVGFPIVVPEGEVSPLCEFGAPPDQDHSIAIGMQIQNFARIPVRSEIFTQHEGAEKRGNNTNAVAREVAATETPTAPLAPELWAHSYLSGTEVFAREGSEDTVSNVGDRAIGITVSKSEATLLETATGLPGNALEHREDFAGPNPTPPQRHSLSVAHESKSQSLLSDLATHEYGKVSLSTGPNEAACGFVTAHNCRPKATGAEADNAVRPANAKQTQTLLGLYLEAEHIGSAIARSAPRSGAKAQSKRSQEVLTTTKTGDGWSTNPRVSIASDDTNIGENARNLSHPKVLLPGDVAKGFPLPVPPLMLDDDRTHRSASGYEIGLPRTSLKALDEAMAVRSSSSSFANAMPSIATFISPPFPEWYDLNVPVIHEIGVDTIAQPGTLIPLGAQVSTGTVPEITDNADPSGRIGDFALEISAIAGFETNPFLFDLPETGTASLRLSFSPTFTRQGPKGDLRVGARIEHIEYAENFDAVQNVGANLESRFILDERLEGNVDLSYDSGVFVTNLADLGLVNGAPDDVGPVPGGGDVTLLGLDQPRTEYQAGGGLRYRLSERDDLDLSMSFRADRFGGQDIPGLVETNFLFGRISYARQVGSGLAVGVAFEASNIDLVEPPSGRIATISPQVLADFAFSPSWELSVSLGLTSIRSDTDFSEENSKALAGDVSICRSGIRANLCLTGARQVVPLGIGGAGLQSNVGASYSLSLSEREIFSLSADYGKASETFLAEGLTFETINGFLSYQLELTDRIRLSADARYTDLRVDLGPDVSNFQALLGFTVSLGRTQ